MRTSEQVVSQKTDLNAVPAEVDAAAESLPPALISARSGARIQSRGGQWHRGQAPGQLSWEAGREGGRGCGGGGRG